MKPGKQEQVIGLTFEEAVAIHHFLTIGKHDITGEESGVVTMMRVKLANAIKAEQAKQAKDAVPKNKKKRERKKRKK